MKVIYHIGLHSTDEDRALRCLLRNSERLGQSGTVVPVPGRFRPLLREAMIQLKGQPATEEIQDQLLEALTDIDLPQRMVFSNDSFICVPRRAVDGGELYPLAGERAPWIRNLFPAHRAEFAFALRNPATFIPALQARFAGDETFGAFLDRIEPEALSWADMVRRLRAAVPDCRLTVWANEDSPLIWPQILEALSGVANAAELEGVNDFVATLMSEEGTTRMLAYLDNHPPASAEHRRRVVSAFLDKYARAEEVEEVLDLPGWSAERIGHLTERYERDIEEIATMEGVTFLAP